MQGEIKMDCTRALYRVGVLLSLITVLSLFRVEIVRGMMVRSETPLLSTERPLDSLTNKTDFRIYSSEETGSRSIKVAKRFRLRRHPDGGAIDPKGRREGELNQTADPQSDPEDIPGIEFDDQGRPRKKEPGQREEPLPRPGLQPPPPLPDPSGRLPILEEPIPPRE